MKISFEIGKDNTGLSPSDTVYWACIGEFDKDAEMGFGENPRKALIDLLTQCEPEIEYSIPPQPTDTEDTPNDT